MLFCSPGTKLDIHVGWIAHKYAKLLPLKNEKIEEWSFDIDATSTEYDTDTGIMTFMFPKPMHEMELPEHFIETANGIKIDESNRILIYED